MSKRLGAKHICAMIVAGLACACAPILSPQLVQKDFPGDGPRPAPGDVLHFETTFLQVGGIGGAQVVPVHTPWRIPLRHVAGALLPSETALLQIALEVRRAETIDPNSGFLKRLTDQPHVKPNTYRFVNSHQVALWDALVDSMVIVPNAAGRFGVLKVDFGNFCARLSNAIETYEVRTIDKAAITAFGNEVIAVPDCLNRKKGAPFIQTEITTLFDWPFANYLNNQDPSNNSDTATKPSVAGKFYGGADASTSGNAQMHARHAVVIERAGASLRAADGDERLWSLQDWQDSGICTDDADASLKIIWIKTQTRKFWVDTTNHNAEIIQSGGTRDIIDSATRLPLDLRQALLNIVIDEGSLAALYPSDVVAIGWGHDGDEWSVRPKLAKSCL